MIDLTRTVMSEYANSPTILKLLDAMNEWIDPQADFQLFYDSVMNLDTATGYGLDVWGRIVGINRTITITPVPAYFGFKTGVQPEAFKPFNQAPFYNHAPVATQNYVLEDGPYRRLIYIKALSNISSCAIPVLNTLLQLLFYGRGRCYVSDLGGMRMRFTFEFSLQTYEISLLIQSNILVRPTGVLTSIIQIPQSRFFGFKQMGRSAAPFNVGVFVNHKPVAGLVNPSGEIVIGWDTHQVSSNEGRHADGYKYS